MNGLRGKAIGGGERDEPLDAMFLMNGMELSGEAILKAGSLALGPKCILDKRTVGS